MNQPHILALTLTSKKPLAKLGRFRWVHEEGRLVWEGKVFRSLEELAPELEKAYEHLRDMENYTVSLALVPIRGAAMENGRWKMEKSDPEPVNGQPDASPAVKPSRRVIPIPKPPPTTAPAAT